MATKGIYLERLTEDILKEYCAKHSLSVSKAINTIIQGKELPNEQKPVKIDETKPETVPTKKDLPKKFKSFRPPVNW